MTMINGAQLVVRALDNQGVRVIFTLCGDNRLIYHYCNDLSCTETGIDFIDFRHEQATGHAAMGYYLATGQVGVCSVQSGPGITDLFPSIPIAYDASIPLVGICTSTALMDFDKLAQNEIDVVPSFRPVTKWSGYCYETARIPEYVNMAFRIATTGRPGPVLLLIPFDVLIKECDDELDIVQRAFKPLKKLRAFYGPSGNEELIFNTAELLLNAKRPLIIAGTGTAFSDASRELLKFAELTQIPVGVWGYGLGEFPVDHPLYFGPANPLDGPGTALLQTVDVALILGSRITELMNYGYMPCFSDDAKLIQVDIKAEEIGRNRAIDIPLVGDVKGVLSQLIKITEEKLKVPRTETSWVKTVQDQLQKFEARLEKEGSSDKIPIQPQRLVKEIRDFMPKDGFIILDGGDTTIWGLTYLRAYSPRSMYFSGGLGIQHLGGGVPMAIATKYVYPERKVLVLTGDGSFLFNGKEIEFVKTLSTEPLIITCDITKLEHVKNLISQTLSKYGKIDILVNTVGIISPSLFENTTYDDIEKQINVNLIGTIYCTKEIIPVMKDAGGGNIVTISSLAGIVPETYSSIYTVTKFALRGLDLTLNLELKKHNITISTIFPDSVDTPMLEFEAKHGGSPLTFLHKPVKPEKVAKAVLKAILKNKAEIYVPKSQGILSKFIMCFPKRVLKMWPKLEKKGEKRKQEFLRNLD